MADLKVVNRALNLLGVEPIASLADSSKTPRIMSALLEDTRKVVLNEFPWSFAVRIDPLGASSPGIGGYLYRYAYPGEALNVCRVYSDKDFRGIAEFRVLNGGSGNVIATNVASGKVEYIADVARLDLWPRQILECLATRLASDAAVQLTGSGQMMSALLEKYMMLARAAAQSSVVEENVPPLRADQYVKARK